MNELVNNFISQVKADEKKHLDKKKRETLIAAGIYESEKTFSDSYTNETPYYDSSEQKYYGTKKIVPEVSDAEYEEILKCIEIKNTLSASRDETNDGAEKTLNTIAVITLVVGIIATFICFFALCFVQVPHGYHTETEFSAGGLATTLTILIGSIATWAIMKVLANISISLKEINAKTKK